MVNEIRWNGLDIMSFLVKSFLVNTQKDEDSFLSPVGDHKNKRVKRMKRTKERHFTNSTKQYRDGKGIITVSKRTKRSNEGSHLSKKGMESLA